MKKALLAGASGLVGRSCLDELLKDDYYSDVEIWIRKSLNITIPKLTEKIIDFSEIGNMPKTEAEHIFCCLGTTIRIAKTKEAFRKVDYDYVIELGKLAERSGCEKFLVVSSLGANKDSGNFYMRTKGEMEDSLRKFSIPSLSIF
ncbi:MAG: nucleoside-diphosphate sugar epimerase, partial [FCB group bacterium]